MTSSEMDELASAIAKLLPRPVSPDIELWSVSEIAVFLKRSPAVVRDRVVCLPRFPAAIRIPVLGSNGKSQPLWKSSEVIEWVDLHQERKRA